MIQIIKFPNGYTVSGHAGYAESGRDIVCAGVSTLAQAGMYMLMEYGQYDVDHESGYLSIKVDLDAFDYMEMRINAILDTIYEGFNLLLGTYPEYITIKEEKVCQIH